MMNPVDFIGKMVKKELKHFKKEHMHEIDEVLTGFFLSIACGMARQSFLGKYSVETTDIETRKFLIAEIDDFLKNAPTVPKFDSVAEANQVMKDTLKRR